MSGGPDASLLIPQKPRLLVVPHIYASDISVREIEFARRLSSRFEVFVLKWRDALHVDSTTSLRRRLQQFSVAVSSALHHRKLSSPEHSDGEAGITLIELPVWQPILLHRILGPARALAFCQSRNHATLASILRTHHFTHVLYATQLFGTARIPGIRTAYDIVDWFPDNEVSADRLAEIHGDLRRAAADVDTVFAVSEPLCEKLAKDCGITALPLPNGADLSRLRNVDPVRVRNIRASLGLDNKFIIGYIGNHGPFTGVDLVVNAFLSVRDRLPDAALLIIGPAHYWQSMIDANRALGVIPTGSIPPSEIAAYFNALDVGVLAQDLTPGTDFAFQIKVVEYSACRKVVVSTPLETWKRLRWPNVLLAEPNPTAWADALVQARSLAWESDWDRIVEPYDWSILAARIADALLPRPDA
ncbi:MAG TPA: glycosyltransferase [Candidatus Acidoferrum sp.]|nr:glycosyltransferase [Candidatus Acidoferrum sp.]